MDAISSLARPEIYAMKPYSSARTEGGQDARIYLDANESPYPPFPGTEEEVGLNRYPEPQPAELLRRFGELYGVPGDQLFLTRGADESIDLLVRAFCAAGRDGILITPPTFVMYETAAEIQGAHVHRVPLIQGDDFRLDIDGMRAISSANPTTKLVFVCSPNNPTGNLMNRRDILQFADELFGKALVVIDELYVDYSGERSLAVEIPEHPNIVVLRSVSKEYSLAGERCGITIAHPEVIRILGRIMAPYSLTVSSIRAVTTAMSPEGIAYGRANISRILSERERLRAALTVSPAVIVIFPSDANFLLLRTRDAKMLTAMMAADGIKIRDRSGLIEDAVRISIGTSEENDQLLITFAKYECAVLGDQE
jgi:histidinol-phosphate aminotransferase